jgi:hypothetical protein
MILRSEKSISNQISSPPFLLTLLALLSFVARVAYAGTIGPVASVASVATLTRARTVHSEKAATASYLVQQRQSEDSNRATLGASVCVVVVPFQEKVYLLESGLNLGVAAFQREFITVHAIQLLTVYEECMRSICKPLSQLDSEPTQSYSSWICIGVSPVVWFEMFAHTQKILREPPKSISYHDRTTIFGVTEGWLSVHGNWLQTYK